MNAKEIESALNGGALIIRMKDLVGVSYYLQLAQYKTCKLTKKQALKFLKTCPNEKVVLSETQMVRNIPIQFNLVTEYWR